MGKEELLDSLIKKNRGLIKTSEAQNLGISKTYFIELASEAGLHRVAHGVYLSDDAWPDEFFLLQTRCSQTIFSHETALYLLGMSDREPLTLTVTAKAGYHSKSLSEQRVKIYNVKKELFELGLSEANSPAGNKLKVYNPERTICDIIRSRSNIEVQDFQDALKVYSKSNYKNIPLLMRYSKEFKIDKILRQYLEVLL